MGWETIRTIVCLHSCVWMQVRVGNLIADKMRGVLAMKQPAYILAQGLPNKSNLVSARCRAHHALGLIEHQPFACEASTMGFFDKIRKAFDTGGIKTELRAPDEFRWQDESLPVSVTLTGHDTEPRTITSIEIRLRDAERDDSNRSARDREKQGIRFEYREAVVLQPGESITLDIEFPLTASEVIDQVGATGEVPAWLSTAAKAIDTAQNLSLDSSHYVISATPKVEGAKMDRGVNRRIRQVGRGDFFAGTGE